MTKETLRRQFLAKRKELEAVTLKNKTQAIVEAFLRYFDFNQINSLHLFLPILQNNEMNTYLIVEAIRQNYPHITIIIPKSHPKTGEMSNYVLTPTTILVENKWHIPEPVEGQLFPTNLIDMVILPLICFDQRGFRVGYGKGFYDRFLAQCRREIVKVGLSLLPPVEQIEDIHQWDVKMDFCVTAEKIWQF